MSDRRSANPTDQSPGRPRTAPVAFLLAVVAALFAGAMLVAIASSGAAAADTAAADTAAVDTADSVDTTIGTVSDDANETTPLDDANGTVEVVVRFTPIEDPEDRGSDPGGASDDQRDAVITDLREHAAAEQDAFDEFAAAREGVTVERELWLANAVVVTVDADAVSSDALLSVANVTAVHENVAIEPLDSAASARGSVAMSHGPSTTTDSPSATPSAQIEADPSGRSTAGLRQIGAPTAWERFGTRGEGATVAVIDTGADPRHRDIDLDGWAAFDQHGTLVSDDLADASDRDGHGTHVAGTVAGGNASGTHIGVAPGADLHAIDVFAENETATFAGVIAAMEYATTTSDADVLQLSLGSPGAFREFVGPVRNARAAGAVVVVAAGNEGENTSTSPGNVYDALAVGAVDNAGEVPPFSSGQSIDTAVAFETYPDDWPAMYVVPDVTAPGVGVVSADANTTATYVRRQGTSMAAPHVAGIAALAVAATDGRADDATVQAAIVETAVHPAAATAAADATDVTDPTNMTVPDDRYGYGVVNAPAAVGAAVAAAPPEPTPTDGGTDSTPPDSVPAGDDSASDNWTSGFGPVAAIVALATVALAAARVR
ncbi:S8 family serine peptidase [Halorubrum laminariae]|uniref:S8 family serine peptidase n=1 Tax=Halorubrum laminariae TaxID=1433523 RepID=A0ABD6BY33_9EURY|nr:S8 family serine peptidase [Halorubrum laminariae]